MPETTNVGYRRELAQYFKELIELSRPDIAKSDLELLADRFAEITDRCVEIALRDEQRSYIHKEPSNATLAWRRFTQELKELTAWYRTYLENQQSSK